MTFGHVCSLDHSDSIGFISLPFSTFDVVTVIAMSSAALLHCLPNLNYAEPGMTPDSIYTYVFHQGFRALCGWQLLLDLVPHPCLCRRLPCSVASERV